jgi:hypothetical protein
MASPKKVNVDVVVTASPNDPAGVKFDLSSDLGSSSKLTFKNDKHPGFDVHFNIVDKDGTGCLFMSDPQDAMWVQKIDPGMPDPCPTSPSYWDQFEAKSVQKGNTRLEVRNHNQYVQEFAFSLRFTKPGWPDPILYDPIGSNQNGDGGGFAAEMFGGSATNLLLVAAGVLAVAFVAYRFLA